MASSEELTIRDFTNILRRHRMWLFLCWGGVFMAVAIYTFVIPPQYRAHVLLRVQVSTEVSRVTQIDPLSVLSGQGSQFNIESLLAPETLRETLETLNLLKKDMPERTQATIVDEFSKRAKVKWSDSDPQLVILSVISSNPDTLALETNTLAEVAVRQVGLGLETKTRQSREFIETQMHEVQQRLQDSENRMRLLQQKFGPQSTGGYLIGRLMELKTRRTDLLSKYTASHPEVLKMNKEISSLESQLQELPNQEIDVSRVARDVHMNEDLYGMLVKRLEDARIVESARLEPVVIAEPAIRPNRPEKPNKPFNLLAGFILGLVAGCGVVWIKHQLDTSLLTTQDIEAMLKLPVLAMVPHIERREKPRDMVDGQPARKLDHLGRQRSRLILNFPAKSPIAEVYHILRTNLPKPENENVGRVLMIASAVSGEGKSVTACNFAIAAAQGGIPTLLVEMDLRKPTVHKLLGLPQEPGLADYFYLSPRWENYVMGWDQIQKGNAELSNAINTNGMANLRVMTSGAIPTNPVALLSSERYVQLLREMRQRFPLTILDCSPVMLFADSVLAAPHVDGVILVYRFGGPDREVLRQAYNHLIAAKAKVLGVVVNDMLKGETSDYSGYYSRYEKPDTL